MKVLLVCAAGMSTSILMKKLEKYAAEQGIDFEITARGIAAYEEVCKDYDCILMGPQISYQKDKIAASSGLPVSVIPPQDYGMANCPNIFKIIDSMLNNK